MRTGEAFDQEVLRSAGGPSHSPPAWIMDTYDVYTHTVSDPSMAISYELARELHRICENVQPASVLELGSGFSTYVLSRSLSAADARLVSVDDDPIWASKTEAFLRQQGVTHPKVESIDAMPASLRFDIVFLDLNYVEVRKDFLQVSYDCCKEGGLVILDDAHKPDYMTEILSCSRHWQGTLYSLRRRTLDSMGRYSVAFCKK
jgi:predicted O-methyltransferase YrrM